MVSNNKKFIRDTDTLFPLFMEVTNDLIVISQPDYDFKIQFISDGKFLEKLGYSCDSIEGFSFLNLLYPDDLEKTADFLKNTIKSKAQPQEIRIKSEKDGFIWVEVITKKFYSESTGEQILINIRDITKQKEIEDKLKKSEQKFETITKRYNDLFNNMFVGFAYHKIIVNKDNDPIDYEFLELNPAFEKLTGLKAKEIINKTVKEILPEIENDPTDWIGKYGKVAISGIPITFESYAEPLDQWFDITAYSPKRGYFAVIFTNITKHKKAEQELKDSENKFRTLFDNTGDPLVILDLDGNIIELNRTTCELFGYSREELLTMSPMDIVTPEYSAVVLDRIEELKQIGSAFYESANISKNGKIIPVEISAKIIDYKGKKAVLSVVRDITERKKTEEKIKESEEKFRTITEQSLMGIAIIQDNRIRYINKQLADTIGYSSEELKSWKEFGFAKIIHPKDQERVLDQIREKQLGPPGVTAQYQFRGISRAGKIIWFEIYSKSINYRGNIADLITAVDITEQKLAEDKLLESEEKYRLISENANDIIVVLNDKFEYEYLNEKIHKHLLGYSKDELLGKIQLPLIHPDDRKQTIIASSKILRKGKGSHQVRFLHKNGSYKWLEVTGKTFYDSKGDKKILTISRDITDRKKAAKKLKESEEKYRDLLESSSVGIMEIDVINNKISFINPRLLAIIGYEKEELTGVVIRDKLIHPKDLSKLTSLNEEADIEFKITDKYGKLKWLAGKEIPHFDKNGVIISVRFWLDDITEKKMYEELIYELNINFLNFTADYRNNIELLLNTGLKLLKGDIILYAHRNSSDGQESYQLITSDNESFVYTPEDFFENLFISEIFKEEHDFPQSFFDVDQKKYASTDPFLKKNGIKGCFGKIIRSQDDMESVICVYYKENRIISGQDKLVMFLICDAIEIEQRRWQVQQDLEKQNITLNKINHLKTELFSRTSHELKTPLISIKGFTELLLTLHKSKLDTEMISILKEIKEGSKRLEKIINLLLESTKLEAGQLELNVKNEDLAFLVKFCVRELKGLAMLRNQTISINLHDELKTKFDKERIYEVISNLLLNSIKFTSPGGVISIFSELNDNFYIISIKDNGIGFTEEEKSQAFKQFGKIERYGQGWDVAIEGTGLGLYITKKLVELHGGKIWLESEGRNKGSTFKFSLPRKK